MSLFENGHAFPQAIRCCPPSAECVPVVRVFLAGASGGFVPVTGKVDTGASRSMLNFATASALGIDDPTLAAERKGTARTATDQEFDYFVHRITVRIAGGSGETIDFLLRAAFAERVARDLFGLDWLAHLCLAVDTQAVHFLRG